nr:hypothetical protein [Kouleothrix sp.]
MVDVANTPADASMMHMRRQFLRAAALLILLAAGTFIALCLLLLVFVPNDALIAFAGLVLMVGATSGLSLIWLRARPLGQAVLPISAGFVITVVGAWLLVPNFNIIGSLVLTIVVMLVSISGNRLVTLMVALVCALLSMAVLGLPQPQQFQLDAGPALEVVKTLSGGAIVIVIWLIADRYTAAQDSAIALAEYLHSEPTMEGAFRRYQDERRIEVLRLQSAARNSLEWFEEVERYLDMPPLQFAYSLLTRSQRISHENLRLRDPAWMAKAESWFEQGATGKIPAKPRPPMFVPFKLRDLVL